MKAARMLVGGFTLVLGSAACSVAPHDVEAPGGTAERAGAVVLVGTVPHLRVALATAQSAGFDQYRVLVCGEAVTALEAGSELESALRQGLAAGVVVSACGLSMAKFDVTEDALVDGVDTVPNALAEDLRLQREGWISVEP